MNGIPTFLVWLLVGVYAASGLVNILGPEWIANDYARWRYPRWFRHVTGSLEIAAAVLITQSGMRLPGLLVGATVMVGALATLAFHAEWRHMRPALVILLLSGICMVYRAD